MTTPSSQSTARVGDKRRLGRSAPRSRSGCTTCKRRKVRCDEKIPVCANCSRLGAECTYQRIQQRKRPSSNGDSTNGSRHSSIPTAAAEKTTVDGPSQQGEDSIITDPNLGSLYPESSLFFDFEAFSRNALALWCSPTTALPTLEYPEISENSELPTLDDAASTIPIEGLGALVRSSARLFCIPH